MLAALAIPPEDAISVPPLLPRKLPQRNTINRGPLPASSTWEPTMPRAAISADLIAAIYQAAVDDAHWPDFATLVGKAARIEHTGVWITENEEVIDISLAEIWRSLGRKY
jgi:hypothetical protein